MAILYLLGTGAAVSDPHRTTTMLALESGGALLLVDCGGDVIQRLMAAGGDLDGIDALLLTHEHPDHVAGFPLFMQKIWLAGRRRPIDVYGIPPALALARRLWESFDTSGWEAFPPIHWHDVAIEPGVTVYESAQWRVTGTPGRHSVPVLALRFESRDGGGVVAYSSDGAPVDGIARLAAGADLLVHEATGDFPGHSTAAGAAAIAARAAVGRCLLVHLPPEALLDDAVMAAARQQFAALEKGQEGGAYRF